MPSAFFIPWFDSFVVHWKHTHWAAIDIRRIPFYGRVVKYFVFFVFNDGVNRRSCEEHDHGVKTTYITILGHFHFAFCILYFWPDHFLKISSLIVSSAAIVRYWIGALLIDLSKKLLIEYKLWIVKSAAKLLGWLTHGLNNGTVQSTFLPPCPRSLSSTLPYSVHVQGNNTSHSVREKSLSTCSHNEIWGDFTQATWHNLIRSNWFFYGKRSQFCGVKLAYLFYFLSSLKAIL